MFSLGADVADGTVFTIKGRWNGTVQNLGHISVGQLALVDRQMVRLRDRLEMIGPNAFLLFAEMMKLTPRRDLPD